MSIISFFLEAHIYLNNLINRSSIEKSQKVLNDIFLYFYSKKFKFMIINQNDEK